MAKKRKKKSPAPSSEEFDFYDYEKDDESFLKEVPAPKKRKKKKKRSFWRKVLIIAVIAVCVYVLANVTSLTPANILQFINDTAAFSRAGEGAYPVDVSELNVISAAADRDRLVLLTDMSAVYYTSSGATLYSRQHGFASPRLSCAKDRCLIYDSGGSSLKIESAGKTLLEETLGSKILAADLSDSGVYAVATKSQGYNAEISLYSRSFVKQPFKWYTSDQEVIAVQVSPNGKLCAVATAAAEGGRLKSYLYLFDIRKVEQLAKLEYGGCLLLDLSFKGNSSVTAVGDTLVSFVEIAAPDAHKDLPFGDLSLETFYNGDASGIAMSFSRHGDAGSGKTVMYDPKGNLLFEGERDSRVSSLYVSKHYVTELTFSQVSMYDKTGKLVRREETGIDSYRVFEYNKNIIAIGNSKVEKYE